ncbi:hypothetical protein Hanom_Chr01g00073081 [Helianthus anomalus]
MIENINWYLLKQIYWAKQTNLSQIKHRFFLPTSTNSKPKLHPNSISFPTNLILSHFPCSPLPSILLASAKKKCTTSYNIIHNFSCIVYKSLQHKGSKSKAKAHNFQYIKYKSF